VSGSTVSVVITCHNLGRYVAEALDSVLGQTFRDFEVILVDDGSTDVETVSTLRSLTRPQTRLVRIENRGLPGARNEGIRQSSGRLLCFLDADDLLEPTWLEKGVAFLNANLNVAFVSHWLRTFGDESGEWKPERCDLETLLTVNTVNGAALVRREPLLAVGGYDESLVHGCEDWDLWLTMVERGFCGAIIPEILFFYRRRADSMSRRMSLGDRPLRLFEALVRKHEQSYRQHLSAIVVAQERALAKGRSEVAKHRLEQGTTLVRAVLRSRHRLAALRSKVERVRQGRLQPEIGAILAMAERERSSRLAAEAELERLHQEVSALRGSWTWRLTAPARFFVGLIRRSARE
jgi:glycosyltransferase involved in cell wall biosynthesis